MGLEFASGEFLLLLSIYLSIYLSLYLSMVGVLAISRFLHVPFVPEIMPGDILKPRQNTNTLWHKLLRTKIYSEIFILKNYESHA